MFCSRCHRSYDDPKQSYCPEDGTPLVRARATRQMGAILDGRYAIQGILGKGGMARVYLALDTTTKDLVAVKVLNRDVSRDRVARERFLREIDVAASIGHPNVVTVLDAGQRSDGCPFIVLELLRGESLGDLLRTTPVLDPALGLPLMVEAAAGLAAAHRAGIIHRDVKPDNLFLVGERGKPTSLKVVDFGMAKLQQAAGLSTTGMTLGTIGYIAPEQALADPVDARTDVYGFGVVMYRAFTGKLPFDTPDDALLVASHLFVPPMRPRVRAPGLDARVDAVIMNALRKKPDNRYPTMDALHDDLLRILGRKEGAVSEVPLRAAPDQYEPVGRMGKEASGVLKKLVGA
jgi:eukaryotic-like serine/threonine-protein kinase